MKNALALIGLEAVTIAPEAIKLKAVALENMEGVLTVDNEEEVKIATEAASIAKGLIADMEKTREAVKRPVLEAGRLIDGTAKEFRAELETEVARIEKLLSLWARKKREEEQAKIAEAAKRQRELEEANRLAERRQREAEEARQRAELAAKEAEQAKGRKAKEAAEKALREAAMAAALAEEQSTQAESAAFDLAVVEPAPLELAGPAEGGKTNINLDFELLNERELYLAYPQCFKMEVKRSVVLEYLKMGMTLPGVCVFEDVKFHAKAVSSAQKSLS